MEYTEDLYRVVVCMHSLIDLDTLIEFEDDDITTKKNRNLPNEIWRAPPARLGLSKYFVSNMGRIKHVIHGVKDGGVDVFGYPADSLTNDEKLCKHMQRHRLIALTFLGDPIGESKYVDHINRIKMDNTLVNLRWVTAGENAANRDFGGVEGRPVARIHPHTLVEVDRYPSIRDATGAMNGSINNGHICHAASGLVETAYGFRWKYLDVDDLPDEEWRVIRVRGKEIPVSNMGRIRYKNGRTVTGKEKGSYLYVSADTDIAVHILVCTAFHGAKPVKGDSPNHKDHNTHNNLANNLEWASQLEQVLHARPPGEGKKKNSNGKIVQRLDPITNAIIAEYPSVLAAVKATGQTRHSIYEVCKNGREPDPGWNWRYK